MLNQTEINIANNPSFHNIFIDDDGSGFPPIVFVHSLAGNSQQWSHQLAHFRKTRRAIAFDFRGHGQSLAPETNDYTMEALAQDIYVVVKQLKIEKFILVGHSLGGGVAISFADKYPQHVMGLFLVDPPGDSTQMPREDVKNYIETMESEAYSDFIEGYWNHILTGSSESIRAQVLQDLRNTPKTTVVKIFKELFRYNPVEALNHFSGPTMAVVNPSIETPFSLHKMIPHLNHAVMTETGHWLHLDKPIEFNQILDDFVSSL